MSTMSALLVMLAGGVICLLVGLVIGRIVWARPREIQLGGQLYQWRRNHDCPFFAQQYKHGRFYDRDGRPVADPHVRAALEEKWRARFKAHGESDFSD